MPLITDPKSRWHGAVLNCGVAYRLRGVCFTVVSLDGVLPRLKWVAP